MLTSHNKKLFVSLISVDVTNNFENWTKHDVYAKANYDATIFTADLVWIAQNVIKIYFKKFG